MSASRNPVTGSHAAIMQAPDRCSYAEVLLEFAGMYRRPLVGIPMTRRRRMNRRVERILNDTLFRCAFMGRKRHVIVAVAFSVALFVSTSHFVVRAAGRVSDPIPLAGQGVQKTPPPASLVHVRTLTIISSGLPGSERLRIARALEGGTYTVEELKERVLRNLRDVGYARATAQEPHLSAISLETPQPRAANVSIQVSPGKQYRLEAIIFEGGVSFSAEQLRDALNVPVGSEFNATAIGKGLDRLRQLYGTNGHINFTAVPMLQFEEGRSAIVMTLSIDEGDVFNFGRLFLEGKETRAGEANALLNAWTPLSGKPYNAQLLSKWLVENATFLPNDGKTLLRHVEMHANSDTHRADILLKFP
jgi:outer membrane protein assembly factor BamA